MSPAGRLALQAPVTPSGQLRHYTGDMPLHAIHPGIEQYHQHCNQQSFINAVVTTQYGCQSMGNQDVYNHNWKTPVANAST